MSSPHHASDSALVSFVKLVDIGCIFRLLPYKWDKGKNRLEPATFWNLWIYNFQKNFTFLYTGFMWFRLIQTYLGGEFSLLAALWSLSWTSCSAGYVTLACFTDNVMHFANRLLERRFHNDRRTAENNKEVIRIVYETRNNMRVHMNFNMLLLYANPALHLNLIYTSPCAPNFISSLFFTCESSLSNNVSLGEHFVFILFEYYNVFKWQYIVSFNWCCIYFGMSLVGEELKKMCARLPTISRATIKQSCDFYRSMKKCELLINILNISYWHYMSVFPLVGIAVVALLMYGTIRFWRLGPAVIMFPLCACRCGFEALTPLSAAGNMSKDSCRTLEKWRENNGKANALVRVMQRSCRKLETRCGSMFSFGKVILLVAVDVCVNQTVNLLVSF